MRFIPPVINNSEVQMGIRKVNMSTASGTPKSRDPDLIVYEGGFLRFVDGENPRPSPSKLAFPELYRIEKEQSRFMEFCNNEICDPFKGKHGGQCHALDRRANRIRGRSK